MECTDILAYEAHYKCYKDDVHLTVTLHDSGYNLSQLLCTKATQCVNCKMLHMTLLRQL